MFRPGLSVFLRKTSPDFRELYMEKKKVLEKRHFGKIEIYAIFF